MAGDAQKRWPNPCLLRKHLRCALGLKGQKLWIPETASDHRSRAAAAFAFEIVVSLPREAYKRFMNYWLIKSEPHVYGIKQLKKEKRAEWDGVRNYQARNIMRDDMKIGDLVLYYHSNCQEPGVVGVARVASEPYPDHTQFNKRSKYYDEKSSRDNPRWVLVDFEFVAELQEEVSLAVMKEDPRLEGMLILRKGNRLSITPVEGKHFRRVCKLGGWKPDGK